MFKNLNKVIAAFSIYLITSGSVVLSEITTTEKEIDISFSKASRELYMDYNLLKSIGYASSRLNPYYINISDVEIFLGDEESLIDLLESKNWLLVVRAGSMSQSIKIKDYREMVSFIEKYGASRDYYLIKIELSKIRHGIMRIVSYSDDLKTSVADNIYEGASVFKQLIAEMGLRNAVYEYCSCKDSGIFYRDVKYYYKKITGKDMENLFVK